MNNPNGVHAQMMSLTNLLGTGEKRRNTMSIARKRSGLVNVQRTRRGADALKEKAKKS